MKHEVDEKHTKSEDFFTNIKDAYHLLWCTMKLPSIKTTALILLTAKV